MGVVYWRGKTRWASQWFTEVISRRSLITFDVSLTEKPKPFYMVISTWWLIVVPYQNILITGSKALRITTERKYLWPEKNTPKYFKSRAKMKS